MQDGWYVVAGKVDKVSYGLPVFFVVCIALLWVLQFLDLTSHNKLPGNEPGGCQQQSSFVQILQIICVRLWKVLRVRFT